MGRFVWILLIAAIALPSWAGDRLILAADESSQLVQNQRADADHLSRIGDSAMLRRFVRHRYLVAVPARTPSYYLHGIRPAYRYSRPWTRLFLDRLSRQYFARFHQPLRVTSLVRTEESQRRLERINDNAADADGDLRSSHLTGATVDISKRYMSAAGQAWMREVLLSLRQRGYLYAIEEFSQPTFHVMVFPNYVQYVKRLRRKGLVHTASAEAADEARKQGQ